MKVAEHGGLEQFRVQGRDAVDRMATDDGEVRHPHLLGVALLNQRNSIQQCAVVRTDFHHFAEEVLVDLIDDFEVPRQQVPKQVHRPLFQRLRKHRVVRVGERAGGQAPSVVPLQAFLVH